MVKPNIFLVANNNHLPTLSRFEQEAKLLGLEVKIIGLADINNHSFHNEDIIINRVTGITYDDSDLQLLMAKEKVTKASIYNPPMAVLNLRDKWKQFSFLTNQGVNTPLSIELEEFNFRKPQILPPFIIKPLRGNKGIGVEYRENLEDLFQFYKEKESIDDLRYLVQPYVHKESELRVLVINNKIIGALEKDVSEKVCNASRVDCTYLTPDQLPRELYEQCLKVARASALFYTGIDVMVHKNNYIFLELNSSPGFIEFEKYSKLNIAKMIIEAAREDDRKESQEL